MKSDRRVKYTQRVLKESLLEILKERPIERVTVKEICDRADINRSTFYVHYGSPQELLDSIKNELYDEIKAKKKDFTDIRAYMRQICEIIYEYRDLMLVLLKAGHTEQLFQVAALWKDDFVGAFTRMGMPADRIEVAYLFITCGSVACIFTWAMGGFTVSIDVIAGEVYKLTIGALNNFSREEDKMNKFPIGVIADSFRKPMPEALAMAAKMGAKGVQVYATNGEMSPEELKGHKRRDFLNMVKDNGLVISALCGDLGRGFGNPELNPGLIERSKLILDMAKELETDIVTTHIGVTPADTNHPRYKIMQDACGELAAYADGMKAHFAIETGPETSLVLKNFLDSLHSTGVAVNLDPANLVMVTGDDPVKAVHNLKDYIVHTHAKDGVRLIKRDPEVIYGIVNGDAGAEPAYLEVPLGEGSVPWQGYLQALTDIGYTGFLTIEREVGEDPAADINKAVSFLRGFIG